MRTSESLEAYVDAIRSCLWSQHKLVSANGYRSVDTNTTL